MRLTLRHRVLITLLPLVLLLAVVGSAGVVLLLRLGNSANAILRENYDSLIAMERLDEALERIDSSFQFALSSLNDAGMQQKGRDQYASSWAAYREALQTEQRNITVQGEAELVAKLAALSDQYASQGDAFFAGQLDDAARKEAYFGPRGLLPLFTQINDISGTIHRMNHANMERASDEAGRIARYSVLWFGGGLALALFLAGLSAWRTVHTILQPVQAVTHAALGISEGNLDQVVPYAAQDELGQLAQAFNGMARHLRDYRRSQSDQLLRAQQTIQATIDSFPDAVLVIDLEGAVEMANPAARRLLGVVPKQKGQAAAGMWQPPEALREPLAAALEGRGDFLPDQFDRALLLGNHGRERAVLPRILTIRDPYGNTLGAAVVLQDVTRLRLLDEVKSNLVATASHELKTPLTSVRLAVHLLLEEKIGPLTPKQLELLLDARENSERLLAMINNLLDLASLEQGFQNVDLRPESPDRLLRAAADAIRPRAEDKGVEVAVEISQGLPAVTVNATRIGHALGNLLDNALAYTERGGRIVLAANADDDGVTFSVSDTGIGIPSEYLPHVFEKFFRIPGRSQASGTGLGLAIVQEIITSQGGTIGCESRPGDGTSFRIRLPAAREHGAPHYAVAEK